MKQVYKEGNIKKYVYTKGNEKIVKIADWPCMHEYWYCDKLLKKSTMVSTTDLDKPPSKNDWECCRRILEWHCDMERRKNNRIKFRNYIEFFDGKKSVRHIHIEESKFTMELLFYYHSRYIYPFWTHCRLVTKHKTYRIYFNDYADWCVRNKKGVVKKDWIGRKDIEFFEQSKSM